MYTFDETMDAEDETNSQAVDNEGKTDCDDKLLTKNEIFTILKNPRRRKTLKYLESNDGEATIGNLAEHIAADENDIPPNAISSKQRKRVYIGLYQVHLRKMDDLNVVSFDSNRGTVELVEASEILFPYLHYDPHAADAVEDYSDGNSLMDRLATTRNRLSKFVHSREND